MSRQAIFGDSPRSHLPFSPALQAGPFVFVSGQASVDDTGKIVHGTFREEFERSISNVEKILKSAGCTMQDVVKVNSYLGNAEDLAEYNELYRHLFQEPFPARTTLVGVLDGCGLKYEVDVIAYREKSA